MHQYLPVYPCTCVCNLYRLYGIYPLRAPAAAPEHAPEVDPELWFWDTFGYLIVRGVMAPGWLAAANAALAPDAGAERFAVTMDEEVQTSADCSPTIAALDASRHE